MTIKEIEKAKKLGAKKIEKNNLFCYKWENGSLAIKWCEQKLIDGIYSEIPVASYERLGLN